MGMGGGVVRLDDYRRNVWSAADLGWEHAATRTVGALVRGERLSAALLLPQAETMLRRHAPADDPRRAATLALKARWQESLGNEEVAQALRLDAERAWAAALVWLERLRPGGGPEGQAECRALVRAAAAFAARRREAWEAEGEAAAPAAVPTSSLAGLPSDRRKLVAAAAASVGTLGEEARGRGFLSQPRPR